MSDEIPYLKCPLCGANFHQSFDCDHEEKDLVDRIRELEAENEELREIHNAQAICAEEFATVMAENAILKAKQEVEL